MKKVFFIILCCMMFIVTPTATKGETPRTEQSIKQSKVMRVGRYLVRNFNATASGTVIIFENGDHIRYLDERPAGENETFPIAGFACALKEGDVVSYKKTKNGLILLKVVSFSEKK